MERVWFVRKDGDEPSAVWTTSAGKVDFINLANCFELNSRTITLNDDWFTRDSSGASEASWTQIKDALGAAGTKEEPVRVSGRPTEDPSKRRKTAIPAIPAIQLFVQSAAESYRKWERECQALQKVVGDTEDMRRPFLEVKKDPLSNFTDGFLLWVRECYTDMRDIMSKAEIGRRFTILGTSGIGKSLFTVFWICYRATLKEKVVWKSGSNWYLLDFTVEPSAKAYGPLSENDEAIREVLDDKYAWLVIDSGQNDNVLYECHVLQACSVRKKNYHEYSKNHLVELQYFPVWEKEEVDEFLDEFEQHRLTYEHMEVPLKEDALRYFKTIGGVPRYVLCGKKTEEHLEYMEKAISEVRKETCLAYFAGNFEEGNKSDALIHIKCGQSEDGKVYTNKIYDFASPDVQRKFGERFEQLSKVEVISFLKEYANKSVAGSLYGYAFELVAHELIKRGGEYRMKKVTKGLGPEEVDPLKRSNQMRVVRFDSLKELPALEADTYYQPRAKNLESIDALLYPDLLLQYFSYNSGVHGYKVKGLQEVHDVLGLLAYKVCSCVPMDKYDKTGFQPWLTSKNKSYVGKLPDIIEHMEQYVIGVDYETFSR